MAVHPFTRRSLLRYGAAGFGAAAVGGLAGAAPAYAQGRNRPVLTHGIQLGDPRSNGAVVWARADRPARMMVEVSSRPDFAKSRTVPGPRLHPDSDGTGRLRLRGLRPGQDVYLRVRAVDGRYRSEAVEGSFRTPGGEGSPVRFVWSGDVAGQGWGINTEFGGMRIYDAMAARRPDFLLHSGDTVYSDGPLVDSVTLPDGRTWRNEVTEEKSKVAETLAEFRGQFAYNLLDEPLRDFSAHVPQLVQWDDHEITNNWYPGEILPADGPYSERRVDVLAERGHQAFFEWQPIIRTEAVDGRVYRRIGYGPDLDVFVIDMRTYRDANSPGTADHERILGAEQARWLVDGLAKSKATWKVVASDMPIGLVVADGENIEGVANNRPGGPQGRESEIGWVLKQLHRRGVDDVVWLTADVHYTAANHYSPDRAAAKDFTPFWEFVSGPLNAGAFPAVPLDPTFGPEQVFVNAPDRANVGPMEGFQHFGEVEIDPHSKDFTVHLRDIDGRSLWRKTLRPGKG